MSGPIRFVFSIIWFAIGLSMVGTLQECTASVGHAAASAQKQNPISFGLWNRALLTGGGPKKK